jgi:hypothetical protein
VTPAPVPVLLRRGAWAVAAGRVALGLTALAWPSVPARPWVGAAADDLAARVFGRALGARDIAMGLGALTALQRPAAEPGSARTWLAAGALSDALDVAASLSSWRELPRRSRWLVVVSAGGAALTGAAGALAVGPRELPGRDPASGLGLTRRLLLGEGVLGSLFEPPQRPSPDHDRGQRQHARNRPADDGDGASDARCGAA